MPAGAGGARPSARLQPEPSSAAPWQGRIPTGITADITRRTPILPTASLLRLCRCARALFQLLALPVRIPLSRVLNGSRPIGRIGSLTRRSALAGAPAFFSLQSFVAPSPGLTKFRQINRHDLGTAEHGDGSVGGIRTIATPRNCARRPPALKCSAPAERRR